MNEIAERCAPFEADLSALLDGQLDAPRAGEVQSHADSCRDCAHRLAALRTVDGELRRVAAVPVDPARIDAMRSALVARLRTEQPANACAPVARRAPRRRRRWLVPVTLTATAAAVAGLLLTLGPAAPVIAPIPEVVVAAPLAAKLRADAEVAASELHAGIQTPIGASTPPDEETAVVTQPKRASNELRPWTSVLVELPPQTGEKLRLRLEELAPEARSELLWRLLHRAQLEPQQRAELRERLAKLAVLSPEELELVLR